MNNERSIKNPKATICKHELLAGRAAVAHFSSCGKLFHAYISTLLRMNVNISINGCMSCSCHTNELINCVRGCGDDIHKFQMLKVELNSCENRTVNHVARLLFSLRAIAIRSHFPVCIPFVFDEMRSHAIVCSRSPNSHFNQKTRLFILFWNDSKNTSQTHRSAAKQIAGCVYTSMMWWWCRQRYPRTN